MNKDSSEGKGAAFVTKLTSQAVQVREDGETQRALDMLFEAEQEIIRIIKGRNYQDESINDLHADVLGQMIVCFKHLYQTTGNNDFLRSMQEKVREGLKLDIHNESKAVFYLRQGDVYSIKSETIAAEKNYQKALDLVENLENFTTAEYMGHLAESMSVNDKSVKAVEILEAAIKLMSRQRIEEWHSLIITSGLYGRLAKAAVRCGQYRLAIKSLWKSYKLARVLAKKHGKPVRLNEFYRRLLSIAN